MKYFIPILLLLIGIYMPHFMSAQCSVTTSQINASCLTRCDGSIIVTASTDSIVSYLWSTGEINNQINNLCPGFYYLTTTDVNACQTIDTIEITAPPLIHISLSKTDASCFGHTDGSATATIIGGIPPYTYSWANGATTSTITGLSAGMYCLTIVDANGCSNQGNGCITIYDTLCPVTLQGIVKLDSNNNCIPDASEHPMPNQIVKITNTAGYTGYVSTNATGAYDAHLDTGFYSLEIVNPLNPYWSSCPGLQTTHINSSNTIDTVNWVSQATTLCPFLNVDLSIPFIRATGNGSNYTVSYCNHGTAPAYNAYVDVSIDTGLNVLNTSIPFSSQTGHTYRFDLDTLDIGECGHFFIRVASNPAAVIGRTYCSEAHIYPDSLCLPSWNGPILDANGQCQNDTIFFEIKNTGSGMLMSNNYSIFEDDVIIKINPFNLGPGDSITIVQVADTGKTYRLETTQTTGFPTLLGGSIVHATVEACNVFNNGRFNTGFVTQYYTGSRSPFIAIDCQQSIGSYDPNDKAAQPMGYGNQHYIYNNTPLKYKVRFQNTGTDTAFNVVIIDTLSPFVDPSTLSMGTSSSPYTWALSGTGILTVTFNNIMLVDSNTNEPASHGFFSYEIQPLSNLATGTIINNQAAIYFDFNPPIFTNTTFHTIGDNFVPIVVSVIQPQEQALDLLVYPNPTDGLVHLEQSTMSNLQIKLLDQLGRICHQENSQKQFTTLDLKKFPPGIYYIHVNNAKEQNIYKIVRH